MELCMNVLVCSISIKYVHGDGSNVRYKYMPCYPNMLFTRQNICPIVSGSMLRRRHRVYELHLLGNPAGSLTSLWRSYRKRRRCRRRNARRSSSPHPKISPAYLPSSAQPMSMSSKASGHSRNQKGDCAWCSRSRTSSSTWSGTK